MTGCKDRLRNRVGWGIVNLTQSQRCCSVVELTGRLTTDVQVDEEHRRVVADRQIGSLHRVRENHEVDVVRAPADEERQADNDHRLDDVPLDSLRMSRLSYN